MGLKTLLEKRLFHNIDGRKKGRESSDLDWNSIFDCLNKIKSEIKENLPYKCLEVYGAI